MRRSAEVFLDGPNGPLYFWDMLVSGHGVKGNGGDVRSRAGKLAIRVNSLHNEATLLIDGDNML